MPSAREHCLRTQKDPQACPTAFFLKARDSSHVAGLKNQVENKIQLSNL